MNSIHEFIYKCWFLAKYSRLYFYLHINNCLKMQKWCQEFQTQIHSLTHWPLNRKEEVFAY